MIETLVSVLAGFVGFLTIGVKIYALWDVYRQPDAGFVFLNKGTRSSWLVFTGLAVVCHLIFGAWGLLGLAGLVACGVYVVDIRPKLNELTNRK